MTISLQRFKARMGIWGIGVLLVACGASLAPPSRATELIERAARKKLTYTLTDETRTLSEVALYLYGKASMYAEIAKWNHLSDPYVLHPGQVLRLKKPPSLTPEQGNQKLREYWKRKFGLAEILTGAPRPENPKGEASSVPTVRSDAETQLTQGERKSRTGDCRQALKDFRGALSIEPWNLAAALDEIRCLKLLKRKGEAAQAIRTVLREHPDLADLPVFRNLSREVSP